MNRTCDSFSWRHYPLRRASGVGARRYRRADSAVHTRRRGRCSLPNARGHSGARVLQHGLVARYDGPRGVAARRYRRADSAVHTRRFPAAVRRGQGCSVRLSCASFFCVCRAFAQFPRHGGDGIARSEAAGRSLVPGPRDRSIFAAATPASAPSLRHAPSCLCAPVDARQRTAPFCFLDVSSMQCAATAALAPPQHWRSSAARGRCSLPNARGHSGARVLQHGSRPDSAAH